MTTKSNGESAPPTGRAAPADAVSAEELEDQQVLGLPERQVLSRASAYFTLFLGAAPAASLLPAGWVPDPEGLGAPGPEGPAEPAAEPAPAPPAFTNVADPQNAAIVRNVLAPGSFSIAHQAQYAPVEQGPTP